MNGGRALRTSFTGYYGMSNFGDDLFGLVCSAAARTYWHSEPRLVGPVIAGVDARYTMPAWYPRGIYGATGPHGKASRLYSFVRAIRNSDVLVMGGGSVINSRESFRKPLMISAQRKGKIELAAVGVSIGPFEDDAAEASVAAFVERFAYIAVRDRRSYELAVRMGLRDRTFHGRDLAGLLPLLAPATAHARPARGPDGPIRIGIAPCDYREGRDYAAPDKQALQPALAAALTRLAAERPLQVDIFSLNEHGTHGDYAISAALQEQLRQAGIATRLLRYRGQGPLSMVQAISRCDAFISARLHGAIVAYLQKVPFTIIDYHPKCNDFADDIGLAPAQRITAERQDVAAFSQAIDAMLGASNVPALSPEIYAEQAQDIFKCAPWSVAAEIR